MHPLSIFLRGVFILEEVIRKNSNVILESRKKLTLTGVKDVASFDDETLILKTELGTLTVKGENLHIGNFNTGTGDLSADGNFIAFVYTSEEKQGGFFSKVFR